MTKKKYLSIPVVAFAALAAVACGSKGGSDGKVHIRLDSQYGKALQTTLERFAKDFNALHDDIEVEVKQVSGSYADVFKQEKTDIEAGTNDWADIVTCYPDHLVDYINYRKAVNVNKFINSSDPEIAISANDMADFTASALQTLDTLYPASGRYAVPFSSSTECMYVNPIVYSLTIPGVNGGEKITEEYINNLTWEELFENFAPKALAYNATLPDSDKFLDVSADYSVCGWDDDGNAFITLCQQYGYGYTSVDESRNPSLDFNNKNNRDLIKKWNEYKNLHYICTEGSNTNKRPSSELFAKGKSLFSIGSTGGITYLSTAIESGKKFNPVCANVPHAEGKERAIVNQGGSWCILSHDTTDNEQRQLAAWKFYKFMISKINCTIWASQSGYAPIRKSVVSTEDWADLIDETGKEGIELLKARNAKYAAAVQNITFVNDVFQGSSAAREYCDGMMGKCLTATTATCTDAWLKTQFDETENNIRSYM